MKKFEKNNKSHKWPKKDKQVKPPKHPMNLFGTHAVLEALTQEKRDFKALYATEKTERVLRNALEKAKETGKKFPDVKILERKSFDASLGGDTVHQGIAALTKPLPEYSAMDLIIANRDKPKSTFVILDQVTDPHNVGAILRSACAFGLAGVVMQTRFAPPIEGTLAKIACGGVEHVPVALETNLSRAVNTFKEHGYRCLALDERGTKGFGDIGDLDKTVLVMGAEGSGIRPSVRDACTDVIRLEMHGALPSINVSNAAAISFYEVTKK